MNQIEKAQAFKALHKVGNPVVLFNIWDAGSAKAVARAGATAIATGSAPVAMANGFADGEKIPLDAALKIAESIVNAVELPVTMDLEGGYGAAPDVVADTVAKAMDVGIVGFNFEDQIVGGEGLYDIQTQCTRIAAARNAADGSGVAAFINARTDIFLKAKPETHTDSMIADAIERASAFAAAGADGFFVPGLASEEHIAAICTAVELPVNIIALPFAPTAAKLVALGAARISYGPVPYRQVTTYLGNEAAAVFAQTSAAGNVSS